MNQDVALRVLAKIMGWDDETARQEFQWLKLMARLKYDGYRDFQAGMRFVESLATWLQQFSDFGERKTAYDFVRKALVYIGPGEMQHLVEQFYPRTVRDRIVHMVAGECNIPRYRVLVDRDARKAEKRLRRQTLFMGLSDGARIDTIRRANSGFLRNEQFVSSTQVDIEKWKDLRDDLRKDKELDDPEARFRLVYLIDDFAGTGKTFLRFDDEEAKGKLVRFKRSVKEANKDLNGDNLFDDNWELCVHHYVVTAKAEKYIKECLQKTTADTGYRDGWARKMHSSCGMVLPSDTPIDAVSGRYDDFIRLTQTYYDPIIQTRHTDVGGRPHLGLGFGSPVLMGGRLPLESEYRDFWEFPYPEDLKTSLMIALLQARSVLALASEQPGPRGADRKGQDHPASRCQRRTSRYRWRGGTGGT